MSFALIAVASLLALASVGSAAGKLSRVPAVVDSMHAVGVGDRQMRLLAGLEILGAVGLLVGIWVPAVGLAAAACLSLYFLGAVIATVRAARPARDIAPPAVLMVLAIATTALELAR